MNFHDVNASGMVNSILTVPSSVDVRVGKKKAVSFKFLRGETSSKLIPGCCPPAIFSRLRGHLGHGLGSSRQVSKGIRFRHHRSIHGRTPKGSTTTVADHSVFSTPAIVEIRYNISLKVPVRNSATFVRHIPVAMNIHKSSATGSQTGCSMNNYHNRTRKSVSSNDGEERPPMTRHRASPPLPPPLSPRQGP